MTRSEPIQWKRLSPGSYQSFGGTYAILKQGADWCLVTPDKSVYPCSTMKQARALAENQLKPVWLEAGVYELPESIDNPAADRRERYCLGFFPKFRKGRYIVTWRYTNQHFTDNQLAIMTETFGKEDADRRIRQLSHSVHISRADGAPHHWYMPAKGYDAKAEEAWNVLMSGLQRVELDEFEVQLPNGTIWTRDQSRELAIQVWQRFGEDDEAAAAAWRRMMQNDTTTESFKELLGD